MRDCIDTERFQPIEDESAGLVMIEALGYGLPLITIDSGEIPEYVGEFGTILEKNDIKKGIMNALNDFFRGGCNRCRTNITSKLHQGKL